ncbi:MAG: hypothetical protein JNN20_18560 [Betaproteobacteria bacterium]|nr:hypothetical protein [Betaproteobacteria bacterium]
MSEMMRRVEIDDAILLHTSQSWKKVALVVVKVANEGGIVFSDLEDDFVVVAQHIENLVGEGRLLAQGNLDEWRHSEICKP